MPLKTNFQLSGHLAFLWLSFKLGLIWSPDEYHNNYILIWVCILMKMLLSTNLCNLKKGCFFFNYIREHNWNNHLIYFFKERPKFVLLGIYLLRRSKKLYLIKNSVDKNLEIMFCLSKNLMLKIKHGLKMALAAIERCWTRFLDTV